MSSILVDNLTGKTTAGSVTVTSEQGGATMQLQQGLAKAWATVDSHETLSDSFNIASVADNGSGQSTLTFSNIFNNNRYCPTQAVNDGGGTNDARDILAGADQAYSTSEFGYYVVTGTSAALNDAEYSFTTIHGDLA